MNKQKTDWDLKLKLVREISEAMAYEYSEYDAMNNNDTPEDIAVNLLDKFLSTQRQQFISEIEGIVGEDEDEKKLWRENNDSTSFAEAGGEEMSGRNELRKEIRERLKLC